MYILLWIGGEMKVTIKMSEDWLIVLTRESGFLSISLLQNSSRTREELEGRMCGVSNIDIALTLLQLHSETENGSHILFSSADRKLFTVLELF